MHTLVVEVWKNLKKIKKDYRLRLTKAEHDLIKEMRVSNGGVVNNVLVIGDLHEPFCLEKYIKFCVSNMINLIVLKLFLLVILLIIITQVTTKHQQMEWVGLMN